MNSFQCSTVKLCGNVSVAGTCVNDPSGFTNKTLDCGGNTIQGNGTGYGVYVYLGGSTKTTNCTINNFQRGFYFKGADSLFNTSNYHEITHSTISNNTYSGISLYYSSYNKIENNNIV